MGLNLMGLLGDARVGDASLSELARGVVGSEILRIAAEIRALKAAGAEICNLTVGDFDPALFPVPESLLDGVQQALRAGHTNYPPSDGMRFFVKLSRAFIRAGWGSPTRWNRC